MKPRERKSFHGCVNAQLSGLRAGGGARLTGALDCTSLLEAILV
jgi:hypothetical protein